jgi:hypothetical protein
LTLAHLEAIPFFDVALPIGEYEVVAEVSRTPARLAKAMASLYEGESLRLGRVTSNSALPITLTDTP